MQLNYPEEAQNVYLSHEDLVASEQWQHMEKLKNLSASVSQDEVLAFLDKAPDIEPLVEDKMS
jgi:spore coat polysaccharide biosynthesis protein SpsF (cytidylyltransferase family)